MNATPLPTSPSRAWRSDLARIGIVLLLAFGTRFWMLRHTEVLSRDSIGFIRFALQLEQPPEGSSRADVIRSNSQPPGYPAALLAVSWPVRSCMGETSCDSMVRSAQITSILASLLLVFPMYFTGRMLFDQRTTFFATLFFQVLPVSTQVTSDGLSDGLFLFMTTMAVWFSVAGLRRGGAGWFAAAGLFAGLAYLVRPEGLVVVLAFGLVIVALKIRGVWPWRQALVRSCALAAGLLLVMTPYVATIGKLTNKPTGEELIKGEAQPSWERSRSESIPAGVSVPLAEWWNQEQGIFSNRALWGAKALTLEIVKASFYVLPLFAFLGIYLLRARIREDAAIAFVLLVCGIHLLLLWFVASMAGYVAERHTLLVVLFSSYFTAAAVPFVGRWLTGVPRLGRLGGTSLWTALIAFAVVAACIPAGMKTLHANRAGHHAAGVWLREHRTPQDVVIDPFAWAEFYSGYLHGPPALSGQVRVAFVVIEGTMGNPHPRLHQMPFALKLAQHGELVYHWPVNVSTEKGKVFVYRIEFRAPANPAPLPKADDVARAR